MSGQTKTSVDKDLDALLSQHAVGALDAKVAQDVEDLMAADQELGRRRELLREESTEASLRNEAVGVRGAKTIERLLAAADQGKHRSARRSYWSRLRAWMSASSFVSA